MSSVCVIIYNDEQWSLTETMNCYSRTLIPFTGLIIGMAFINYGVRV